MALTMDNSGAALVAGAPLNTRTRQVRVIRPFMVDGQAVAIDSELTLPATFAGEMVGANKAVYIAAPDAAPAVAATAAPKPQKTAKGQGHAEK